MNFMNTARKTNNNNNFTKEQKDPNRKKFSIDLDQDSLIKLPKTQYNTLIDSVELAKLINEKMKGIFGDYIGCTIAPSPFTGALEISFYFTETRSTEGLAKAIERTMQKKGNSIAENIQMFNRNNMSRVYNLTDKAKDILELFIDDQFMNRNKTVNWNRIVTEETEYATGFQYLCVSGININKLLRKLAGKKNELGHNIEYQTSIVKPMNNQMVYNNKNVVYLLLITALDCDVLNKLIEKSGLTPSNGQIPMIRA